MTSFARCDDAFCAPLTSIMLDVIWANSTVCLMARDRVSGRGKNKSGRIGNHVGRGNEHETPPRGGYSVCFRSVCFTLGAKEGEEKQKERGRDE